MLRFRRIGGCPPPGKLTGIAAQAQHAMRRQSLELANQSEVGWRKETRISQLLHPLYDSPTKSAGMWGPVGWFESSKVT